MTVNTDVTTVLCRQLFYTGGAKIFNHCVDGFIELGVKTNCMLSCACKELRAKMSLLSWLKRVLLVAHACQKSLRRADDHDQQEQPDIANEFVSSNKNIFEKFAIRKNPALLFHGQVEFTPPPLYTLDIPQCYALLYTP